MTMFEAYLLVMLDGITLFFLVLSIFCGFASFVTHPFPWDEDQSTKTSKIFFCLFVLFGLLFIFVPSTKQAAAILTIPAIVNNEKIQTTVGNGLDLMELTTEWMKDQMGNKIKETKQ